MSNFLLVDMNSDYKAFMNYKELKEFLIENIGEDILANYGEYDIVKDCYIDLSKMAREEYTDLNWIKNKLESYSYKTIDLLSFQRDLEDIKSFIADKNDLDAFDKVLDRINKEANENGK